MTSTILPSPVMPYCRASTGSAFGSTNWKSNLPFELLLRSLKSVWAVSRGVLRGEEADGRDLLGQRVEGLDSLRRQRVLLVLREIQLLGFW